MLFRRILIIAAIILSGLSIVHSLDGFLNWLQGDPVGIGWAFGALATVAATVSLIVISVRDYRTWIALGEGGLPSNLRGWIVVTAMRPLAGDPLDQSVFAEKLGSESDIPYLSTLPMRDLPRPIVAPHAVPHRQISQIPDAATMTDLSHAFDDIVKSNGERLEFKLSQYEKHNQAIWLKDVTGGNPATGLGGEIGHFHPSDGSMHTILSPSDARQVIDKGWGELHSMARFKRIFPTETFLMLYAPAKPEHVPIIKSIIAAATRYALPVSDNQIKG